MGKYSIWTSKLSSGPVSDHGQSLDHQSCVKRASANRPASRGSVTVHRKKNLLIAIFESNFVTFVFLVRFSICFDIWNALFMPDPQMKVSNLYDEN